MPHQTSAAKTPAERRLSGAVESVTGGVVTGWLADMANFEPVEVELLIDGLEISRTMADGQRDDLLQAGIGTGNHAYCLPVSPVFLDGRPHEVAVRVVGTQPLLVPTPREQVLGEPPASRRPVVDLPAPKIHRSVEISVIMPTYNRGKLMESSIVRYLRAAEQLDAEVIVIDDGSRDDTPDRLKRLANTARNFVTDRVPNGGPARARNLAASMARGRILVLVGDDVAPVDDNFLSIHAAAHTRMSKVGQAVLGKISWPDANELPINLVMSHIQGEGEQQFGYRNMKAYQWYSWQVFYSSNVSIKKALVRDWMSGGYDSSFYLAALEDSEFALRTMLRLQAIGEEFGAFYVPAAHLVHYHPFTVAEFLSRQVSVGMMAQRFLELHPSHAEDLGLADLLIRLAAPPDDAQLPIEHYFTVFEGLKSWALVIESHYGLGQQNWHGDLLRMVFQLAFFEGFLRVQVGPEVNIAAGCRYVLETVRMSMHRAIATEMLGEIPGFVLV